MALRIPFALLSALFVKKPTVNGTIGKIQGRKKAAIPASIPKPKVTQSDCEGMFVENEGFTTFKTDRETNRQTVGQRERSVK
jgi:hypothetical protein